MTFLNKSLNIASHLLTRWIVNNFRIRIFPSKLLCFELFYFEQNEMDNTSRLMWWIQWITQVQVYSQPTSLLITPCARDAKNDTIGFSTILIFFKWKMVLSDRRSWEDSTTFCSILNLDTKNLKDIFKKHWFSILCWKRLNVNIIPII